MKNCKKKETYMYSYGGGYIVEGDTEKGDREGVIEKGGGVTCRISHGLLLRTNDGVCTLPSNNHLQVCKLES